MARLNVLDLTQVLWLDDQISFSLDSYITKNTVSEITREVLPKM